MTWEQWLFEYIGLQDKETAEIDQRTVQMRVLRDLLIALLGNDILGPKTEAEVEKDKLAGRDPTVPNIVSLAMMLGRPETLKRLLEQKTETDAQDRAVGDKEFDAISEAIMQQAMTGHSDLPPTLAVALTGDLAEARRAQRDRDRAAMHELLGIRTRIDQTPVAHIGKPAPSAPGTAPTHEQGAASLADLPRLPRPDAVSGGAGAPPAVAISEDQLARFREALG